MKLYSWAVLVGGLGGGLLSGAHGVFGQATPPPLVELKQNYPNPFNPATTIPFTLNGDLFANGHRPKVSLKIYNVLADLELTCATAGSAPCAFSAYWDGNVLNTATPAASGVYIYQLVVDGRRFT